jgi:hypothetical protein
MQPDANLQCRLLFDGLFHPQGPSRSFRCWRRGLTSWWRGPRHGNGNSRGGRWNCSHLFGLGPGCRGSRTTSGHCQHVTISMFSNLTKQQTITWKIRFPAPFACALPGGTRGRASANSTAGLEELSLLASPSVSVSARGLPSSVDSLLCRAAAARALFASAAALGSRWSGRGMSGCGG